VKPSKVLEFHKALMDALKFSINDQQKENLVLNKRTKELEDALLPQPLFIEPIYVIKPLNVLEDTPKSGSRLKGASSLLTDIRKYVCYNMKKRATLILDIWELATSSTTLSTRILNFKEYLQKDLENDENFYKEYINTFFAEISSMNDVHEREKNLSSKVQLKQINACCLRRIECLREMLVECVTL
jgi:hypothetical protein